MPVKEERRTRMMDLGTVGTSAWICPEGHRTPVYLIREGITGLSGGSGWDYCNVCSLSPTEEETDRMMQEVLDEAIAGGRIGREEYEKRIGRLEQKKAAGGMVARGLEAA